MLVKLPNGLIDGADHFDYVEIGELLGKHQNYLADKELVVGNIGHVDKLVKELVLSLQTKEGLKWQGDKTKIPFILTASDIEMILIKIRENTYGPEFYFNAKCDHCEHINKDIKIKLSKLDVVKMTTKQLMDVKSRIIKLPKSGLEAELKPLFLKDLFEVIKVTKGDGKKLVTSLSKLSLKRLGDKSPVNESDIGELPARDLMFLQESIKKVKLEGSIDTDITHECTNCSRDFDTKLNAFDPDFFVPSKDTTT